jgi:CheY-like chemotaxis protein
VVAVSLAAALELALERVPEAIVCPIDLAVIDGSRLAEILRGNPRTRGTSFVFLVNDELDAPLALDSRDATVVSPWSAEDILDDLDAVEERGSRFGELRTDSEIEGKLAQISVVDLLQIFQMNHRSGTLRVSAPGNAGAAAIALREGQVVDAVVPLADGTTAEGEKALYRLLRWNDGRFEFVPGPPGSESARITKGTRVLLLEGMRHKDEWDRVLTELPPLDSRLRVLHAAGSSAEIHPLTLEVLEAAVAYRRIDAIVDHCSAPDFQVLRCLADLIARGVVAVETPHADEPRAPGESLLFGRNEVRRLREWISLQKPRPAPILKVPVVAADAASVGAFVELLRESTGFVVDGRLARDPQRLARLGTLGHLPLGEGLGLRLIALPAQPAYAPLWEVAAHGMLGAVALAGAGGLADARQVAAVVLQLRSRVARPVVPALVQLGSGDSDAATAGTALAAAADGPPVPLPAPRSPGAGPRNALRSLFERLLP